MTEQDDIPKTVAVIIYKVPSLVLRTGLVYLRTKRRARKGARSVMKGMVENGVPPELARRLADDYEGQLSLRQMVGRFAPGPFSGHSGPP